MSGLPSPLDLPTPADVPLVKTPLNLVLAQVRFPTILKVNSENGIADFQDKVRKDFPYIHRMQGLEIEMNQFGIVGQSGPQQNVTWQFDDEADEWKSRISLTKDFVAFETRSYTGRDAFVEKLKYVLQQTEKTLSPSSAVRFGIRYINQIKDPEIRRISDIISKDYLSAHNTAMALGAQSSISVLNFYHESVGLNVRWGRVNKGTEVDPQFQVGDSDNWIIDIDAFYPQRIVFNSSLLTTKARELSETAYKMFRYMIKDEFLDLYGRK